ncbi:MAG TPA: isochorismatase family protein [Thermodesulfobacteriota bacterium]|nr:isochorismatase family protein [Thermodesulfobacteriota bacterium]
MGTTRRHVWEDVIDDETRQVYANYAGRTGLRQRPALLCIDNYNAVFGDRPEPVLTAIRRFPSSCGEAAWAAVAPTQRLMAAAREVGIPIVHTTRDVEAQAAAAPLRSTKRRTYGPDPAWSYAFFPELAPRPGELVVRKSRASAFYGTPLEAYLVQLGVDTLIVCGNSTSGCVRATVLEGQMRGYAVAVVEECVFDRSPLVHKVNLFDMNAKYADVLFLDEVLDYLGSRRR